MWSWLWACYAVAKCSVCFDNLKIFQVTDTAACPIKRNNTKISAQKRKRQSKDTKTKQKGSKKPKVTKCITAGYAACHKITTEIPIYDVNCSWECLCDHIILFGPVLFWVSLMGLLTQSNALTIIIHAMYHWHYTQILVLWNIIPDLYFSNKFTYLTRNMGYNIFNIS